MSLILIALLQATAEPVVPPQRVPSALLSSADYPVSALLLGQEGEVEAQLTIATDGRPTNCTIVRSSGFPALDSVTCESFEVRARFKPALDSQGRPTIGKWTQTVRWTIQGNELPVEPWTIRLSVVLDKKGSPTNCAIQAGGALKRVERIVDCAELSGAFIVPPELTRRYAGHQAVLIFDQQFVPKIVGSINTPRDLTRFPLLHREVIRLDVDGRGRVGSCIRIRSEGDYQSSAYGCDTMRRRRFKPDTKGRNPVAATATTAIYVYVK